MKGEKLIPANIVTEKDGIPVIYSELKRGFGVRVIHPQNPKAPSKNLSMSLVYIAPGGVLQPHQHENEEIYVILEGKGIGRFGLAKPIDIKKGMFLHLPPGAEHGIENNSDEMMLVLTATAPPIGPMPEWKMLS